MRVGLISDTHGKLRPQVLTHFGGVDLILHAGDVNGLELLDELALIAPVRAVWGNTDGMDHRAHLPEVAEVEAADRRIVVVHGHQLGSPTPERLVEQWPDADVIVYGHTHRPMERRAGKALVLNPGGAGAARFGIPPTVMVLELADGHEAVELIEL
ncbi:MAG: metallophosphoesterase family protein [Gemmatimonadota bacterium]